MSNTTNQKHSDYIVNVNEDFGHQRMHLGRLRVYGDDLIESFYNNLYHYNSSELTREQVVEQFPNKVKNSLGQEMPLHPKLYAVYTALKEALPWIDIAAANDRIVEDSKARRWYMAHGGNLTGSGFMRMTVFCPGDTYAMGVVTVDEETSEGKTLYVLNAPGIDNPRFRENSTNRNSVRATTIDKLIANCKKYLRPYTAMDGMLLSKSDISKHLMHRVNGASSMFNNTLRKFYKNEVIEGMADVVNKLIMGASVTSMAVDATVRNAVIEYSAARDVYIEEIGKQHYASYIQVRTRGDYTDVSVIPTVFKNTSEHPLESHFDFVELPDFPRVWVEMDKVDEEFANKVATLSMLKEGEYVEGLGVRISSTQYWVTHEQAPAQANADTTTVSDATADNTTVPTTADAA